MMCGCWASTAWRLGSVALRHRQPICAAGRRSLVRAGIRRFLPSGGPAVVQLSQAAQPLPRATGPTARGEGLARLEAVLYLARQPLRSRKLAQLAGLADGTQARSLVRKLNKLYDAEGAAFRVEEVAGGFQLMSRSKFAPWLRRLHDMPVEIRFSAPAMETLAVVAYRQPVLRAKIEGIRGVQCGEILRQLIERELVRIVGRSEELGRPFLYGTTRQFLQIFGLRHLDELPRRELWEAAQPDARPFGGASSCPTDGKAVGAQNDQQDSPQPNHSHQTEEETKMTTTATANTQPGSLPDRQTATVSDDIRGELPHEEHPFDEFEDDDEYDEDEDEEEEYEEDDVEDDPWEEVEDGEEEDEEEDDDEEWEEEDDEEWEDEDEKEGE